MEKLYRHGADSREDLFKHIDSLGGWPLSKQFVVMKHVVEALHPCYFSNNPIRDDYNTTLYSRDEYLWWKMSENGKLNIRKEHFQGCKTLILDALE